jgi:hypothetical protein
VSEAKGINEEEERDPSFVSEEVCHERHRRVDEKLDCYEKDIASIKQKIDAALIFMIIVLVTLLIDLGRNGVKL